MKCKQIVVNARALTQPLTGIQRYTCEVVKRLPPIRVLAPTHPLPGYSAALSPHSLSVRNILGGHLWEQLVLPTLVPRDGLLWCPSGLGILSVPHQVLTIHDIASLEHPEWYDSKYAWLYSSLWPRLAPQLRRIITVSQFTRKQIISMLKVPEERVIAIPSGIDARFVPQPTQLVDQSLKLLGVRQPYILAVSAISPRKNFERLYEAWKLICSHISDLWLVVVGEAGMTFAGKTLLDASSPQTLYLGRVDDKFLPALYSGAIAFIYPSLYEGFGFPPLEAMACGTPVVTSNLTSLPEMVGDAALLVNPYEVEDIAWSIQRLVEDSFLREKLKQKGFEQVRQFTWERTAELTWQVLQKVAQD